MRAQQIRYPVSRRAFLGVAAATAAAPISMRTVDARASHTAFGGIKAVTFDVQGTLVDYYQPFARVSAALGVRKGLRMDWPGFLRDWNAAAASIIQAIDAGGHPWIPAVRLYREALDNLLAARGLAREIDEADRLELMSVWTRMAPWPDSVEGIAQLRRMVTVATLSNAGMAAIVAIARRGGLTFDAVLSGELVHAYKPAPEVYRAASDYLGFPPGEIMMIAAHKADLRAAKAAGFRTAYIPRPLETGPGTMVDRAPETFVDIVADDLLHLSEQIGAA